MKKVKKVFFCGTTVLIAALLVGACNLFPSGSSEDKLTSSMLSTLDASFLQTHAMMQGASGTSAGMVPRLLSANPLTPFSVPVSGTSQSIMKATITRETDTTDGFTGGTVSDYPEPGQTTVFTVAVFSSADSIYKIKATTSYPTTSPALETIEEYLVKDESPGPGPADGQWNQHDPIVDSTGTRDNKYRTQYYTKFRDGSIRNEQLLLFNWDTDPSPTLYAEFDVDGTLDYPAVFSPTEGTARYSSIVLYTHVRTNTLNYWFWEGSRYQNTVGIRYYTEQDIAEGSAVVRGTTAVFEKTLESLLTLGGSLADSLADIYAGGTNNVLAKTVTRQEVLFDSTNTAVSMTTRSKVAVYDVTGNEAVYIEKIGTAAATGDLFQNSATEPSIVQRSTAILNAPYGQPLVTTSPPSGDLGTLYASIENGAAVSADSITGSGEAYSFNGSSSIVVSDPGTGSAYDLTTAGTVSAWVKLNSFRPWAGIVHKGIKDDFSDEAYSLQFWSKGSDTSFAINYANNTSLVLTASGKYSSLSTNTWYYIVATWDSTEIVLYINGIQSAKNTNAAYTSQNVRNNDAPVIIGAQFASAANVYKNYFGFDGIIDGWGVKSRKMTATEVRAEYNRVTGK